MSESKSDVTLTEFDRAMQEWLGNYFGKRDGETLGEAIERNANQPHPSEALFAKKDGDK
jgi:hypothetical protein